MTRWGAIVLAGERPGGSALGRALDLPATVLAPLAGQPCLMRVVDALLAAESVADVVLCGPRAVVVDQVDALRRLVERDRVAWRAPAAGPAASAREALTGRAFPQLLTSGDHGLLTADVVDAFCGRAAAVAGEADLVVGLVPHPLVAAAFPESRRTVLRFADGGYCGSNLFALLEPGSARALDFWCHVEAYRKQPWKIARRLGAGLLLRYLTGRLGIDAAFAELSRRSGARVAWVAVESAEAAVDVDSEADWRLADRLLRERDGQPT